MSRVITFYSYKGGTGRSMALANVAWIMASAGNRVLTIDWDLEAPGLHRYFHPFLTDKELNGQESQGVIEMAIDFAVRAATPVPDGEKLSDKWYEPYADFSKWRQRLQWPSGETLHLGERGYGEIDFVPAGRQDAGYAARVNHFDWHGFYEKLGGGAFFDAAKRKFDAYDYVLIDSRTGVSDTSGICTMQMPDTLVVCFTLNYQSIKGALAVARSVREMRPDMRIFPVPTRIDGSEKASLDRMKNYAANAFSPLLDSSINATDYWFSMEVPYSARYAYAEKLALFEVQSSITASTLPSMERLSSYLTDGAVGSVGQLPEAERASAMAAFEGGDETKRSRPETSTRSKKASQESLEAAREAATTNIFISCAAADRDIARAVADGLRSLDVTVDGRINVRLAFDLASHESNFEQELLTTLKKSDFFIAVGVTGDFGYTAYEAGIFMALMEKDAERRRESARRLVWLYSGERPNIARDLISINIDGGNLSGSRDEYVRGPPDATDLLTNLFLEIAEYAEARLPPALRNNRRDQDARRQLREHIIPALREKLFDSLSTRLKLSINFGSAMQVDLPPSASMHTLVSIPDDAKLEPDGRAFEIFGMLDDKATTTWGELRNRIPTSQSATLLAIEQMVVGAVSSTNLQNNSQIVRSAEGDIFRAMLTRRMDYYNGRKVVRISFVQQERDYNRRSNISILINYINLAARIAIIFERDGPLSVDAFRFMRDPAMLQERVRDLIGQLDSLNVESAAFGLNQLPAVRVIFGDDGDGLAVFDLLSSRYARARDELHASADHILNIDQDSVEFPASRDRWLNALNDFVRNIDESNSIATVRALENLKKALVDPARP
jgi:cellulose biosynthesis protein BcsQ